MFWKFGFHTPSAIDGILARDDFTLQELLDDEDILQECVPPPSSLSPLCHCHPLSPLGSLLPGAAAWIREGGNGEVGMRARVLFNQRVVGGWTAVHARTYPFSLLRLSSTPLVVRGATNLTCQCACNNHTPPPPPSRPCPTTAPPPLIADAETRTKN
jgi:hypothetical protein